MGNGKKAKVTLKLPTSKEQQNCTSFKWTPYNSAMANFVKDNYEFFKKSQKVVFLRKMKESLMLECSDVQLKNGFTHFMARYTNVKAKLNSSGFGVDPEKDASLDKGWVLKACPYYDILDEVMGSRPNITPPATLSTSASFENQVEANICEEDPFYEENANTNDSDAFDKENANVDGLEDCIGENEPANEAAGGETTSKNTTPEYIKNALAGIDLKKRSLSSKTPLGVFAQIMGDKTQEIVSVKRQKLEMQNMQFAADQEHKKEIAKIELLKVNSQMEIETKRLELENARIEERRKDREHEILKLQMQHEFELKKLELQLKKSE